MPQLQGALLEAKGLTLDAPNPLVAGCSPVVAKLSVGVATPQNLLAIVFPLVLLLFFFYACWLSSSFFSSTKNYKIKVQQ